MSVLDKLNQKFVDLKVDIKDLPEKTQRKISQLKKNLESKLPTYRDKEGNLTPTIKKKCLFLIEDIVAETEAFVELRDEQSDPKDPKPTTKKMPEDPPPPAKTSGKNTLLDWLGW